MGPQSLFFIDLPDLKRLCAVKFVLNAEVLNSGIRDEQIKLCRHLLFLYDDIVTSPEPGQLNQILVIMSTFSIERIVSFSTSKVLSSENQILFYKSGKLQAVAERHSAQLSPPERVTPAVLQSCLSYTLVARLSPNWNKAGHLLVQGADFLTKPGRQNAVELDLNVSDTELCISIQVFTICLPPSELADFNISTSTLQRFINNKPSVIQRHFISSNWCYILPSMKMGQIVSISHNVPPGSQFQKYEDFQIYWNMMYGYELPKVSSEDMIYCSMYFKLIGERLFTYPFICIRSQPLQFFPQVNLEGVLSAIVTDLKSKFTHLCGFPIQINEKPLYPVKELTRPQSQEHQLHQVNLTNELSPRSLPTASQHSFVNNSATCNAEACQKVAPLTQQPKISVFSNPDSSQYIPPTQLFIKSAASAFLSGRSLTCCSSETQNKNVDKFTPVFQRKLHHGGQNNTNTPKKDNILQSMSVFSPSFTGAQKKYEKAKNSEQVAFIDDDDLKPFKPFLSQKSKYSLESAIILGNRDLRCKKEPLNKDIHASFFHSSCEPSIITKKKPASGHETYPRNGSLPNPSSVQPYVMAGIDDQTSDLGHGTVIYFSPKRKEPRNKEGTSKKTKNCYRPLACVMDCKSLTESGTRGEYLELKSKKLKNKPAIQDVDVEMHARNNQLSKLNSATLQDWLKKHGVSVKSREKKEELVTKIMQFVKEF